MNIFMLKPLFRNNSSLLFFVLFLFLSVTSNAQSKTGAQVANGFVDFMRSSSVVSASFVFGANDASGKEVVSLKCSLVLRGNFYKMVNENIEVYCDGKTKWIINRDAGEVSILNNDSAVPDPSENPLAFFASLKELYSFPNKSAQKVLNGVKAYGVSLTALKGKIAAYPVINLLTEENGRPLSVEFRGKNGFVYKAESFRFIQLTGIVKDEDFRPNASKLNGLYINDLR